MTRHRNIPPVPKCLHAQLLEQLAAGEQSPTAIARELGLTIDQLALWASQPEIHALLAGLARLENAFAHLLVSKLRPAAVAHLARIAAGEDGSDIMRKACVDLLRINVAPDEAAAPSATTAHDSMFAPSPTTARHVRRWLERLGRQAAGADHAQAQ